MSSSHAHHSAYHSAHHGADYAADHGAAHGEGHAAHQHGFSADLAEHLNQEAVLSQDVTASSLDRAAAALQQPIRTVLDLGSGTGAGAVALAQRFPDAQVHCLDVSADMLGQLADAVAAAGVADRVHGHLADLDGDWTRVAPPEVDLVWASLSLHHAADPAQVLRRALSVLWPGGVVVVTEMSDSISLTPDDLGTGRSRLADRVAEGLAAFGYPVTADWTLPLAEAGFVRVQREVTDLTVTAESTVGAKYLATQVSAWQNNLADIMTREDLAALKVVEHEVGGGSSPIALKSGRVVWVAARPDLGDAKRQLAARSTNSRLKLTEE